MHCKPSYSFLYSYSSPISSAFGGDIRGKYPSGFLLSLPPLSMSRRKVQMCRWKEGGQRRSPRLSAEPRRVSRNRRSVKEMDVNPYQQPQGPASRTRARKKTKLRPLEDVAASPLSPVAQQDDCEQSDEDDPISSNRPTTWGHTSSTFEDQAASPGALTRPSTQLMPDKRMLELLIDVLQRRDTNELFAEPVDPQEVEDYYEIIEEPMDFGTMRAKLHEGIYKSLEQFEHDAFLIPRNAMHFNSSTTIYFRQARAIHELAKKVFHILKTDPERFEMEFSGTRRRTRRPINEVRVPLRSSSSKLATDFKTRRMNNASSKKAPHVRAGLSNYRKNIGGSPGFHDKSNVKAKDNSFPSDPENDGRVPSEADWRSTYWTSFLTENDSIVSMVYNNSKQLPLVEQQEFGYRDSLMMFVKDLGPTAQMVARRKLASCSVGASNYHAPVSKCLFPEPKFHDPGPSIRARELIFPDKDITTASHGLSNLLNGVSSASFGVASSRGEKKTSIALRGDISSIDANVPSARTQLGSLFCNGDARDMDFSGMSSASSIQKEKNKKDDNQARELKPCSEKLSDFRLRSDYKSLCSWPPKPVTSQNQIIGFKQNQSLPSPANGSAEADQVSKPRQALQLGSSSYIFNLSFLETKLRQLNNASGVLQQGSSADTRMEKNTRICNETIYQQFSLDPPRHRDLVLQL